MKQARLCCYFWRQNQFIGNLGDALTANVLDALGYSPVSRVARTRPVLNEGRCLLAIGSLLTPERIRNIGVPVDIWGCGWRGEHLLQSTLAQMRVCAVRGPHTVAGLGLPDTTPVGDPVLLLPHLVRQPVKNHGHTLIVPHFLRVRLMPAGIRQQQTGCDELLSPQVIQAQKPVTPGWARQALALCWCWVGLGVRSYAPWAAVKRIAGAAFVLTGSLHGAILAQAYGVPWAAYDDGYVDAPAKWLDWAAFLGIQIKFVTNLAEGERWWQMTGRKGTIRDLAPLISAFPYPIRSEIRQLRDR